MQQKLSEKLIEAERLLKNKQPGKTITIQMLLTIQHFVAYESELKHNFAEWTVEEVVRSVEKMKPYWNMVEE